ncbi:MAG: hypothetical protein AAF658_20160, partial [Myxococcota bacterium]
MRRDVLRLAQYRDASGTRILSLEPTDLPDGTPIDTNLIGYIPERGSRLTLRTEEETASIYAIGRRLARGSRVVSELNRMSKREPKRLLTHSGSVVRRFFSEPLRDFCASSLASVRPAAVVPGDGDLSLGRDELLELAEKHELPYVAANLRFANETNGERPFPSYVLREVEGLSVAIVGIVPPSALSRLPLPIRAQWTVEEQGPAVGAALTRVREELGRRPDLTVLLVDSPDERAWRDQRGIDVVIGSFETDDHRYFNTVTKLLDRKEGLTDSSRYEMPVAVVRAGSHSVGEVLARFVPRAFGEPMRLVEVETNSFAVLESGPVDESVELQLRGLEEDALELDSEFILADPAIAVAKDESLKSLVYGDRVLSQDRFVRYSEAFPAAFTDALWMRFVTTVMLLELET